MQDCGKEAEGTPSPIRLQRFAVHVGAGQIRVTDAEPRDHVTVGRLVTPTRLVLRFGQIILRRTIFGEALCSAVSAANRSVRFDSK